MALHPDAVAEYEAQAAWFEEQLHAAREAGAVHILVFSHIPWYLHDADEGEDIGVTEFQLPRNDSVVSIPSKYFHIPRDRRRPALELMKRYMLLL